MRASRMAWPKEGPARRLEVTSFLDFDEDPPPALPAPVVPVPVVTGFSTTHLLIVAAAAIIIVYLVVNR